MIKRSYFYFVKERSYLFILAASTWIIIYCLMCTYELRKPTTLTMPGALALIVGSAVFVFGVALYQFLNQEKHP